jgi:signal transduction histidine kinase
VSHGVPWRPSCTERRRNAANRGEEESADQVNAEDIARNATSAADASYRSALALIAHELRSPAAVVSGYLRMLTQGDLSCLTDQQRRMLEQAGAGNGRVLRLIQELGDLAALESGDPVRAVGVPVFSLCDEAIESNADTTKPSPIFTCADADRTALVDGDAGSLKRAFGALFAATAREHGTDPLQCYGFVSGDSAGRNAVIAFGPVGLEAKRDDIVKSRTAFDRWRGGTGLSLPIACRIIESHGGGVWTTGSADARATCVSTLPVSARL